MTEPRTAAGRALLASLTMGYDPAKGSDDVVMPAIYEGMTKDILAIEDQAAAPALDVERLAKAISTVFYTTHGNSLSKQVAAEYARLTDDARRHGGSE
jgi:hypothetical protein